MSDTVAMEPEIDPYKAFSARKSRTSPGSLATDETYGTPAQLHAVELETMSHVVLYDRTVRGVGVMRTSLAGADAVDDCEIVDEEEVNRPDDVEDCVAVDEIIDAVEDCEDEVIDAVDNCEAVDEVETKEAVLEEDEDETLLTGARVDEVTLLLCATLDDDTL